jgi:Holliday junction resolvasome RuvABC endonuclease subunit
MKRIIAIDCGTVQAAIAVLDCTVGQAPILVHLSLLKLKKKGVVTLPERLVEFRDRIEEVVLAYKPGYAAVEDCYFNKFARNLRSLGLVLMSIGVAVEVLRRTVNEPILIAANVVRGKLDVKKKQDTWKLVNTTFEDQLKMLGYTKGILISHIDLSDAVALGWVAQAQLQ